MIRYTKILEIEDEEDENQDFWGEKAIKPRKKYAILGRAILFTLAGLILVSTLCADDVRNVKMYKQTTCFLQNIDIFRNVTFYDDETNEKRRQLFFSFVYQENWTDSFYFPSGLLINTTTFLEKTEKETEKDKKTCFFSKEKKIEYEKQHVRNSLYQRYLVFEKVGHEWWRWILSFFVLLLGMFFAFWFSKIFFSS